MAANPKVGAKAQKRATFEQVFAVICDELVAFFKSQGMPQGAAEWFTQVRVRGDDSSECTRY